MSLMNYFDDIGARIGREWEKRDREEEALPSIARDALAEHPPPPDLVASVVANLLDSGAPLPRQFAPVGAFGQPGVTCFMGRDFFIDLYFWNTAIPAVHNHPFCGCFTILQGQSLHNAYTFEVHDTVEGTVMLGDLHPAPTEWLGPGDVVAFSSMEFPLIHSLVHVDNPSVSLVIRTERALDYLRYLPPHIAMPMAPADDRLPRQLLMFQWLRSSGAPDYADRLLAFLDSASFETSIRTLSALYDPELNDALLSRIRERHGAVTDLVLPSIETAMRLELNNQYREQFTGDARILLSVLSCAEDQASARRLLRERLPDVTPEELLAGLAVPEEDRQAIRAAWDAL